MCSCLPEGAIEGMVDLAGHLAWLPIGKVVAETLIAAGISKRRNERQPPVFRKRSHVQTVGEVFRLVTMRYSDGAWSFPDLKSSLPDNRQEPVERSCSGSANILALRPNRCYFTYARNSQVSPKGLELCSEQTVDPNADDAG